MNAPDAAVYHNNIKMILAKVFSTFSRTSNSVFSDGQESLPKSPPDCTILGSCVFDTFVIIN